jgi:hypothetical protein
MTVMGVLHFEAWSRALLDQEAHQAIQALELKSEVTEKSLSLLQITEMMGTRQLGMDETVFVVLNRLGNEHQEIQLVEAYAQICEETEISLLLTMKLSYAMTETQVQVMAVLTYVKSKTIINV